MRTLAFFNSIKIIFALFCLIFMVIKSMDCDWREIYFGWGEERNVYRVCIGTSSNTD
jgi:hypothetical protein